MIKHQHIIILNKLLIYVIDHFLVILYSKNNRIIQIYEKLFLPLSRTICMFFGI